MKKSVLPASNQGFMNYRWCQWSQYGMNICYCQHQPGISDGANKKGARQILLVSRLKQIKYILKYTSFILRNKQGLKKYIKNLTWSDHSKTSELYWCSPFPKCTSSMKPKQANKQNPVRKKKRGKHICLSWPESNKHETVQLTGIHTKQRWPS